MSRTQPPKPLTGGKVFLMLVAFFGVVIGVNMVMMRLAIQTLPGTEVDSAYSASLAYEKEIATARDQSARNWKVDAHVERHGAGERQPVRDDLMGQRTGRDRRDPTSTLPDVDLDEHVHLGAC